MDKEKIKAKIKELQQKRALERGKVEKADDFEKLEEIRKEIKNIDLEMRKLEMELEEIDKTETGDALVQSRSLNNEEVRGVNFTKIETEEKDTKEERQLNKRQKEVLERTWALTVLNRSNEISKEERSVLGTITTTDKTFVEATAGQHGHNNAGVLIPTTIMTDVLERIKEESPILKDILVKQMKGITRFPYKKESKGTGFIDENKDGDKKVNDYTIEFGYIDLIPIRLAVTATLTMEMLKLTPEEFVEYIKNEMVEDLTIKMVEGIYYGSQRDEFTGIIPEATLKVENEANLLLALKKGLNLLPRGSRKKAKIYMSSVMKNELMFTLDNNKRPIFGPFNAKDILSIALRNAEEDPYLKPMDIVIGRPDHYILNQIDNFEIISEVKGKDGVVELTAQGFMAGKPIPGKFVYVKIPSA